MSVTLWNAIILLMHAFIRQTSGRASENLDDVENWRGSVNSDRGAIQLLMFAGKQLDITNKLQELVRPR